MNKSYQIISKFTETNNTSIIGFTALDHISQHTVFCRDCFIKHVLFGKAEEIDTIERFQERGAWIIWQNPKGGSVVENEEYTVSRSVNEVYAGVTFYIIRDDSNNVDRQNVDDYPDGLVCQVTHCNEVIVTPWEDDSAFVHFCNRDSEYRTVYNAGNLAGTSYYVLGVNEQRIAVTDVISGTDDYYEIGAVFEKDACVALEDGDTWCANVYIADRDDFYTLSMSTGLHMKVQTKNETEWQFC